MEVTSYESTKYTWERAGWAPFVAGLGIGVYRDFCVVENSETSSIDPLAGSCGAVIEQKGLEHGGR